MLIYVKSLFSYVKKYLLHVCTYVDMWRYHAGIIKKISLAVSTLHKCLLKLITALFTNDDVEGQDMFKFKSRHTKLDLHNKVKAAISNSPKLVASPKTPRRSIHGGLLQSPMTKLGEATPKHVKDIMKKSKCYQ